MNSLARRAEVVPVNNKVSGVLKNLSYTFIANIVGTLLSLVLVALVPKRLGTVEYGYWQLYLFYTSYVGFFHFGWIDGVLLRYGGREYEDLDKSMFHSQFWMLTIMELVITLLFSGGVLLFYPNADKTFILLMTALCCIVVIPRTFIQYLMQATNRIQEYAKNQLFEKVIYAVTVVVLLVAGTRDYKSLLLADIGAKVITLCTISWRCRDIIFHKSAHFMESIREAWTNITVGVKLLFANIAGLLIIGIVRFSIEQTWSVEVFGKVSLTMSVSNLMMLFINAVSVVMFPVLKRTPQERWAGSYTRLRSMLVTPMLGLLVLYYPAKVILSMWLPQYAESLNYMALLFPMCLFEGKMSMLINTYLKALRRENWMMVVNIVSVLLSLAFSGFVIVWMQNLELAVLSILVLLAFRCVFAELVLAKVLDLHVGKGLILELIMTAVFVCSSWILGGILGCLVYLGAYAVYLLIKRSDVADMLRMVKSALKPASAETNAK